MHNKIMESVTDSEIRTYFQNISAHFRSQTPSVHKLNLSNIDDIIQKFEMCDDTKIKATVIDILKKFQGKNKRKVTKALIKTESLLDSVNTAEDKYSTLYKPRNGKCIRIIEQIKEHFEKHDYTHKLLSEISKFLLQNPKRLTVAEEVINDYNKNPYDVHSFTGEINAKLSLLDCFGLSFS